MMMMMIIIIIVIKRFLGVKPVGLRLAATDPSITSPIGFGQDLIKSMMIMMRKVMMLHGGDGDDDDDFCRRWRNMDT